MHLHLWPMYHRHGHTIASCALDNLFTTGCSNLQSNNHGLHLFFCQFLTKHAHWGSWICLTTAIKIGPSWLTTTMMYSENSCLNYHHKSRTTYTCDWLKMDISAHFSHLWAYCYILEDWCESNREYRKPCNLVCEDSWMTCNVLKW